MPWFWLSLDPKFKNEESCINGERIQKEKVIVDKKSYAGQNFCKIRFSLDKFNKIISKEFGRRCEKGICHFHIKRDSFICGSYSHKNQAVGYFVNSSLLAAAILLLGICSGERVGTVKWTTQSDADDLKKTDST